MKFKVKFREQNSKIPVKFRDLQVASDGGYDRGYEVGYEVGNADGQEVGYTNGYNDGLAKRTYETWTITLADGSVIEKEIALL